MTTIATTTTTMTTAMTRPNTSPVRMVGGEQQIVWTPKQGGARSPHSLTISPNLDALLEYDEKVRGPSSPQSAPPIPTGLPPPPRRSSRKPQSPTSPKVSSPLIQETSSGWGETNPYINPAPMLEDVPTSVSGSSSRPGDIQETGGSGGAAVDPGSGDGTKKQGQSGPADGGSCSFADADSAGQPSTKNRVDKLLGIGKRPFALFSDPSSKADLRRAKTHFASSPQRLEDVSNKPKTAGLNLRERARAKGKLLKLTSYSSNERLKMRHASDDLVLDIRRHSTDSDRGDSGLQSFRRRPLLSHVRPSSQGSSVASTYTSSSTSTYEPASTIDARISISSAMYPASTVHSHGMWTDEPLPIIPPNRTSSLYSRQSFMDITSPDVPEFSLPDHTSGPRPPSPSRMSDRKPPIPTTPKPIFNRTPPPTLPPTTNFLDLEERSDLIRKNRKLAQVFGQPPGPDVFPSTNHKPPVLPMITATHQHASPSIPSLDTAISQHGVWLPASDLIDTRRHSEPFSPDSGQSFQGEAITKRKTSRSPDTELIAQDRIRPSSPTSFIDLSDDFGPATLAAPKTGGSSPITRGRPRRPSSPSAQSIFESLTPEQQAEETRKRKREKLAKLHRFLGSRVPTNLVLGPEALTGPALPPLDLAMMGSINENEVTRKDWLRRRRSSSAAAYRSTWSDEIDRIKEDLNSTEKAINVRRAQKMEKVFGVAPPQTLYHTRRSPSPSVTNVAAITGNKVSGWTSPGESLPGVTGLRNPNRSSYKKNKDNRPGTSESGQALLPKKGGEADVRKRASAVYTHYQESLNSLNDIIDRDDRESLAELHEYLNSGDMSLPPPLQSFTRTPTTPTAADRRLSNASSIKSERRRSLPARTSIISIGSEYSVSTPRPDATDFQARRRRAAKLTQFFGVDYRELITDVLESIESGLEHERKRGTLNPEEVEDLLARLRKLRTRRSGIF